MSTYDCKAVQREIDETNLDASLTPRASEHLSICNECRRFYDQGRTLRGLMAELETVGAPADFDFRLRARLARERPSNGFGRLLLLSRPLVAVALVVLLAVVVLVVKSRMSSSVNPPLAVAPKKDLRTPANEEPKGPAEVGPTSRNDAPKEDATAINLPRKAVPETQPARPKNTIVRQSPNVPGEKLPRTATRESAGTGAATITLDSLGSLLVVPVDARTFKLSIDNGQGGARTISLPPVSFGSQRLLAREASFAPVSSSKGVW